MKKFLSVMLAAIMLLMPINSMAASGQTEGTDVFIDAIYDSEHTPEEKVIDWSDLVTWEVEEDIPSIEEVDWKTLSDEELTDVINHSTYEDVGMFLLGLSDEEFEEILERDTTLIYPVYSFRDTGEYTMDADGNEIPIQEREVLADHYFEYALSSVMSVFKWEDATGTYGGTADGYYYFKIRQDGSTITNLTVRVYGVRAGQGTVSNYDISGTYGPYVLTSVKAEKENYTWSGIVLNGYYTKPAHYYTLWSTTSGGLGRYDPWNADFTDWTLDSVHRTSNVTDTIRIQNNGCNAGMVDGYNAHLTGTIDLLRYYNTLYINPNGGTHGGKTSTYQLANKQCKETTTVSNPTRVGYDFTGWTVSNGTGAGGSLSGTTYTHCNNGAVFSKDTESYVSGFTASTTLKANWKVKNYPYEVRHYKQLSDGSYPSTPDEVITGSAAYNSSYTGSVKSYTGYKSPAAQTIKIGTGSNVISYYYEKSSFELTVNPNGGTWRGSTSTTTLKISTGSSETIEDPEAPISGKVKLIYHNDAGTSETKTVRKVFTNWTKSGGGTFNASTKKFTSGNGNATLTANYSAGKLTLPALTREYYTFIGWDSNPNMDPDEETPDYLPGTTITVTRDMELHAIWKMNFELDAHIERILAPHDPVFENGEKGVLKVSLVGFVNRVDVTFPYELSRYDGSLSMTHTLEPKLVDGLSQEFFIPLYSAEGGYRVTVTAYNEEGDSLTVYPNLTIAGTILDDFRTRLR